MAAKRIIGPILIAIERLIFMEMTIKPITNGLAPTTQDMVFALFSHAIITMWFSSRLASKNGSRNEEIEEKKHNSAQCSDIFHFFFFFYPNPDYDTY